MDTLTSTRFLLILFVLVGLVTLADKAIGQKPPERIIYRIRTEERIHADTNTMNSSERRAVHQLQVLMDHWPKGLWIASDNGLLRVVKMPPGEKQQ